MVRIMSDTSTLFSIEEGKAENITIAPLSVTINNKNYREYEEISSKEFLAIINEGHLPTSSQPALGEVLANYEAYAGEEIVNISVADGLSGAYESAVLAAEQAANKEDITVINSRTLCGPHRYIVQQAQKLAAAKGSKVDILALVEKLSASTKSFLVPDDFDYLKRGGRLSPLAANMIGKLKVIPVLVQSEDGKKLEPHRIHRKEKAVINDLVNAFKKHGVGKDWLFSICHADNLGRAEAIKQALHEAFPATETEIFFLSPSFITQGGPRCVSAQVVQKI